VSYVLLLAIVALLISIVLVGTSDFVETQRERAIHSELDVLGNRLAADLATADTLARASDGAEAVRLRSSLPEHVAKSQYTVRISDAPPADTYAITLTSATPSVSTTVVVKLGQDLESGRYSGGDLIVVYDSATDRLEVRHG
jgi:hypothetical protein